MRFMLDYCAHLYRKHGLYALLNYGVFRLNIPKYKIVRALKNTSGHFARLLAKPSEVKNPNAELW